MYFSGRKGQEVFFRVLKRFVNLTPQKVKNLGFIERFARLFNIFQRGKYIGKI